MSKQYELCVERTLDGEKISLSLTKEDFFNLYELGIGLLCATGAADALDLGDRDAKLFAAHAIILCKALFDPDMLSELLEDNEDVKMERITKEKEMMA